MVLWAVVVVRIILHHILYGARSSAMLMIMVRDFSSDCCPSVRLPACLVDYGWVCVRAWIGTLLMTDCLSGSRLTVCLRVE